MGVAKRAVGYIRVSDNPQADLDRASLPGPERVAQDKKLIRTVEWEVSNEVSTLSESLT